jgi:hypothetical protein
MMIRGREEAGMPGVAPLPFDDHFEPDLRKNITGIRAAEVQER